MDKLEEMRAIGRLRCACAWEETTQIDLEEMGWEVGEWNRLAQDRNHWRAVGKKGLVNFRMIP